MGSTVSEILWVRWLLDELGMTSSGRTQLFCDNQAARSITNNLVFHERTKHVEMHCYFIRERVESNEIQPMEISTRMQISDILSKPLGDQHFYTLLDKLGIQNLHVST